MPKRSNHVAFAAVTAAVNAADGEKSSNLPVQLTKKQCIESFVEVVNDSAGNDGMFWYKQVTCAICMDPIDKPNSGVVLDCKHHPFHASCIVKALQRDRRCPASVATLQHPARTCRSKKWRMMALRVRTT